MVEEETGLHSNEIPLTAVCTSKAEEQRTVSSIILSGNEESSVEEGSSAWDEEQLDLGIWTLPLTPGTPGSFCFASCVYILCQESERLGEVNLRDFGLFLTFQISKGKAIWELQKP